MSRNGPWTVEAGRQIYFNEQPFISIGRGDGNTPLTLTDGSTRAIVELLNSFQMTPDEIQRRYVGGTPSDVLKKLRYPKNEIRERENVARPLPRRPLSSREGSAPSKRDIDTMFDQYVETALWSSNDDNDVPLDHLDAELDDSALDKMRKDVESFARENADLIAGEWSQAGHDFWLTRNGHGVGFWEKRDWPEREGKLLTKAAKAYGEVYLYVGDDGMIYHD